MNEKFNGLKRIMIIVLIVEAAILVALYASLHFDVMVPALFLISEAAIVFFLFEKYQEYSEEQSVGVKNVLGNAAGEAFITG